MCVSAVIPLLVINVITHLQAISKYKPQPQTALIIKTATSLYVIANTARCLFLWWLDERNLLVVGKVNFLGRWAGVRIIKLPLLLLLATCKGKGKGKGNKGPQILRKTNFQNAIFTQKTVRWGASIMRLQGGVFSAIGCSRFDAKHSLFYCYCQYIYMYNNELASCFSLLSIAAASPIPQQLSSDTTCMSTCML